MEYITAAAAAQRWGVSARLVQRYCAQGRIAGARKFGASWEVPAGAQKPRDPRAKRPAAAAPAARSSPSVQSAPGAPAALCPGLMPLMNTPFAPGACKEAIRAMPPGAKREIAEAEYCYFSGRAEQAAQRAQQYMQDEDAAVRLSACLICAYANLSLGQIQRARSALAQVRGTREDGAPAPLQAGEAFVAAAAAVLLHLPLPDSLPPAESWLPLLEPGLRSFALYVQAHYLYLQKEYEKSAGIVEATLAMGAQRYPIPAIYLHLVAVMDHMSLRRPDAARAHLLAAWQLARPDDLIEGFGEHHGLLGGMLEAVIKPNWPEDFKRIIAITYRFSAGWRKVHNPDTGHDVADNLTTTEFTAAMLAARGWTNREIAAHMNISQHTVKRYVSVAMQKLNVHHRCELERYMLQ